MAKNSRLQFDAIGYWSELKLHIVQQYAGAYSKIFSASRQQYLKHVYVDAFAGAGVHLSRKTGEWVAGSPLNALNIDPPFHEYHLIDIDGQKVSMLKKFVGDRKNVFLHTGDCNQILAEKVFPQIQYEDYRRGLCLLDPYGLHLNWSVIEKAGHLKTIDLFLNFPIMDMNRNVLWSKPEGAKPDDVKRMNAYWGDDSWKVAAYKSQPTLFDGEELEKVGNQEVVNAFRKRLLDVASFAYVPEPLPMRNSKGAVVYYLFFASHKPAGKKIVEDVFKQYRQRGIT